MSDIPQPWKMPDWMKPLEGYFQDSGGVGVETLMNTYGGKCGSRLSAADVELRAMIANAQVGLLVALRAAGLIGSTAAAPGAAAPELAEAVDDLFVVPMAVWRDDSPCHRAILLLRQDIGALLAGKPREEKPWPTR